MSPKKKAFTTTESHSGEAVERRPGAGVCSVFSRNLNWFCERLIDGIRFAYKLLWSLWWSMVISQSNLAGTKQQGRSRDTVVGEGLEKTLNRRVKIRQEKNEAFSYVWRDFIRCFGLVINELVFAFLLILLSLDPCDSCFCSLTWEHTNYVHFIGSFLSQIQFVFSFCTTFTSNIENDFHALQEKGLWTSELVHGRTFWAIV